MYHEHRNHRGPVLFEDTFRRSAVGATKIDLGDGHVSSSNIIGEFVLR